MRSMCLCVCGAEGEVFLPDPGNLPQPQHHEGHPGERWRETAGQTALLQKGHGAQAEQGTSADMLWPHTHLISSLKRSQDEGLLCLSEQTQHDITKSFSCIFFLVQNLPEIILISCDNDLHLCREYFMKSIGGSLSFTHTHTPTHQIPALYV